MSRSPILQPSSPSPTTGGVGGRGGKRHILKNLKPPGSSSSSTVSSAGSSSSNAGLGAGDGGVGPANYGPVVSANLQVLKKILEQQRSNAAAAGRAAKKVRKESTRYIASVTVEKQRHVPCR